jgi:hypothetical protein
VTKEAIVAIHLSHQYFGGEKKASAFHGVTLPIGFEQAHDRILREVPISAHQWLSL